MWSFFRREGGKKGSAPKIEVLLSLARVMSTIHNLLHAHLFFAHKRVPILRAWTRGYVRMPFI